MLLYKLRKMDKKGRSKGTVSFFVYICGGLLWKEGKFMGRSKKITSKKRLQELWEEYKNECDNQMVLTHDFSSKNSEFVSKELRRSVTYTIEGFCVFVGISRQAFYKYYANDERYVDIVTRMREECEVDARKKFELQVIPSQLAGLWMSSYGYSTKQEVNEGESQEDDGFIDALNDTAREDWCDGEDC